MRTRLAITRLPAAILGAMLATVSLGAVAESSLMTGQGNATETCVLQGTGLCRGGAETKISGGMFYVTQPNNCGYKLYVTICIKTKSGRDDCGADSVRPGGRTNYWHNSDDVTGQYTVKSVGVLKGGDDWSCDSAQKKLGVTD